MYYFSINDEQGVHLGFLVWMVDDDKHHPLSGSFAIKAQAPQPLTNFPDSFHVLNQIQSEIGLSWQQQGDVFALYLQNKTQIGYLKQQYLTLYEHIFVLNDLTGVV